MPTIVTAVTGKADWPLVARLISDTYGCFVNGCFSAAGVRAPSDMLFMVLICRGDISERCACPCLNAGAEEAQFFN